MRAPTSAAEYAYMFADQGAALRELLLYKARVDAGGARDETGAYDALYAIACEREGKDKVDRMLSAREVKSRLDVAAAGVSGKRTGEILSAVKELWLSENGQTPREELLSFMKGLL